MNDDKYSKYIKKENSANNARIKKLVKLLDDFGDVETTIITHRTTKTLKQRRNDKSQDIGITQENFVEAIVKLIFQKIKKYQYFIIK